MREIRLVARISFVDLIDERRAIVLAEFVQDVIRHYGGHLETLRLERLTRTGDSEKYLVRMAA